MSPAVGDNSEFPDDDGIDDIGAYAEMVSLGRLGGGLEEPADVELDAAGDEAGQNSASEDEAGQNSSTSGSSNSSSSSPKGDDSD
jgi:hypothetical protein